MNFRKLPVKLRDCVVHGAQSGAELFIVEGDSASEAVTAIRDEQFQAVLPMQGKPINVTKSSRRKVLQSELFAELFRSLGYEFGERVDRNRPIDPDDCRFERILFLFDPDADGIHCEALMLILFQQLLRPLLVNGRLYRVRAPMFQFTLEHAGRTSEPPRYAYSEDHARRLFPQLESLGIEVKRVRYRGLAGMHRETLLETCVDPRSGNRSKLQVHDAEAAMSVFGPKPRNTP